MNSLMLLPVTVLEGGKTNKTVVRMIYARETYSISILNTHHKLSE